MKHSIGYYCEPIEEQIISEALYLWAEQKKVTRPDLAEKAMDLHYALENDTWILLTTEDPHDTNS